MTEDRYCDELSTRDDPPRWAMAYAGKAQKTGGFLKNQNSGKARHVRPADGEAVSFAIDPLEVGLLPGGGNPLPRGVRAKMEAAFGVDFSGVRVHVGSQASRIGAVAFTVGHDIYFAPGHYRPDCIQGQELIGHELAHVVQQREGRVRAPARGVAVVQDPALEAEADRLGRRAAAGIRARVRRRTTRRASPGAASATVQLKPDFAIPAHYTGEQYITKAALVVNERATVTVFADPGSIEKQYRDDGSVTGLRFHEIYNRRHQTAFTSDIEARAHLVRAQETQLARAVAYLRSGLPGAERRVKISPNPVPINTSGSTQAVRDAYKENARDAAAKILRSIQGSLSYETCVAIRRYFFEKGFQLGGKYTLFWGRRSGEMVGAGAYLDTNETMVAQMMIVIRKKDPQRKFVLIGDRIDIPKRVDGVAVPAIDIDLVAYWKNGLPGNGDANAQLYFLNWLAMATDTVAIGTNSGILEIPHLLGMATVYLENVHLHKRKGLRWQLLASKYQFEIAEGDLKTLIKRTEGTNDKVKKSKMEEQLQSRSIDRVLVNHPIRPRLARFSTTGATELWVLRKQVLGAIRQWIVASGSSTLDSVGPTQGRVMARGRQDTLLKLIVRCQTVPDDQIQDKHRLSYVLLHDVKKQWEALSATPREQCLCPLDLKRMAITAIDALLRRHALTKQETGQFWETFNYTYVHSGLEQAPDYKAGMRAWLRDTEDIWNQVKDRGVLGSRVDQLRAAGNL